MRELDQSHPSVIMLRVLLPDATVCGGSFSAWLPPPSTVRPDQRAETLQEARSEARTACVQQLLALADAEAGLASGPEGEPLWPLGLTTSLTYKGPVVLGATIPTSRCAGLGIDLERVDRGFPDVSRIAPEGLPAGMNELAAQTIAFSAKEAVFKAQYPLTRRMLEFEDVVLTWTGPGAATGLVRPCGMVIDVRFSVTDPWIVTAACRQRAV